MNNKIVVEIFNSFMDNDFSVCRVNFRGVGKSDGDFDNGQGELADAAASLDWIERENFDNSQCWIAGFSFGSLIAMQLLMRRPEINRFISKLKNFLVVVLSLLIIFIILELVSKQIRINRAGSTYIVTDPILHHKWIENQQSCTIKPASYVYSIHIKPA